MMLFRAAVRKVRSKGATELNRQFGAPPVLELLETRHLLSAPPFYSPDGTGNNEANPLWGSAGQKLLRKADPQYGDGVSTLAGSNRPSARAVSTAIVSDTSDGESTNDRFMSDMVYAWGQFIDHDLDLTSNGQGEQAQAADISVPRGDRYFDPDRTGTQVIDFTRSEFDPSTGTSNPRQQSNDITAWLDASMVYGSDPVVASALRIHEHGRLKTSPGADEVPGTMDDLLPLNNQTYFPGYHAGGDPNNPAAFAIANAAHIVPDDQLFMGGDVRANENIELTAMHALLVREHNRVAADIEAQFPSLDDDAIYQAARAIVIAEMQSITINEFLPALVGTGAIAPYSGYNESVNPGIANEFSTAGFRLGHSLINEDIDFLNPDATTKFPEISLAEGFFNPTLLAERGPDPILKYLATDNAQELDNRIVSPLQNFLFGPPGSGGFDLASLNIQRGRDHGLADYNSTRAAYGLAKVTNFAQITGDSKLQSKLEQLYGSVNNIDLWVGGLAERHVPGSSLGPLFRRIVIDQFQRVRDGDRLWFENLYSGDTLAALEQTTLANLIARNTVNTTLQSNVFFFKIQIFGTVFNDVNQNGIRDPGDAGVSGRIITVIGPAGEVVAQTRTATDGTYSFDNLSFELEAGVPYRVIESTPSSVGQTTFNPPVIAFARGATYSHIDFGNGNRNATPKGTITPAVDPAATLGPLDDQIDDIVLLFYPDA